jgi:hypothetical protein
MVERHGGRIPDGVEEGVWQIRDGRPFAGQAGDPFARGVPTLTVGSLIGVRQDAQPRPTMPDGGPAVERLEYNNPFGLNLERVWFDGKIVYASEMGEIDVDPALLKVAQEYQIVYAVELGADGKPERPPERVPGQYNIYDSVPGMDKYSPLWLFNYVVVPRDYVPNTLRSEADCLSSGYPILKSTVIEN